MNKINFLFIYHKMSVNKQELLFDLYAQTNLIIYIILPISHYFNIYLLFYYFIICRKHKINNNI